jgi:hypothetical protein
MILIQNRGSTAGFRASSPSFTQVSSPTRLTRATDDAGLSTAQKSGPPPDFRAFSPPSTGFHELANPGPGGWSLLECGLHVGAEGAHGSIY